MIQFRSVAKPKLKTNDTFVSFVFGPKGRKTGESLFRAPLNKALSIAKQEGFEGKTSQVQTVNLGSGPLRRVVFIGLESDDEADLETIRNAASTALNATASFKNSTVFIRFPQLGSWESVGQAAAEGALLGSYRFTQFKGKPAKPEKRNVVFAAKNAAEAGEIQRGLAAGQIFGEATLFARDLINTPPSDMTPEDFLRAVKKGVGKGVKITAYDKKKITRMGMGGLLGVNRGSAKPPLFIHFSYKPKGRAKRKIGICGKGITFDSGGLSLKPPKAMETMKIDMSGAAAVAGVFKALSKLKPSVEVHGFTPLTENLPGEKAVKPGDVLKAMNGKTIEVLNTDAEGRLVLADALSFASRQNLDELFDVATLTGAAVVALGNSISGVMSTSPKLVEKIKEASLLSGEKVWELPLDKEYESHIKSPVADIKNMGRPMQAGTIIGGIFLKEFVKKGLPWAHIDIAGTAWTDIPLPLARVGATGAFVRTFLHHILATAGVK